MATAVAVALRGLPDRPLRPQQVVDALRGLQVVRDPVGGWFEADLFDRMLGQINTPDTAGV